VPKSLALRLIVALTVILIVVEGSFALYNVRTQESQLLDGMVLGADQLSRSITSATWHSMLADHRSAAYEVMQTIAQKQGIDRIRIFNKEGRVMFSTGPEGEVQVDKNAEACFLCHAREQPLVRVDTPSRARIFRGVDGNRKMGMVTAIYNEPACSGAPCHAHPASKSVLGVLDVTMGLAEVDREMTGLKRRAFLTTGLEVSLLAVFMMFFTRRFVGRPIEQLIEGTKAVSAMELDRPVAVRAGGELGELARSFDAMRERLKEARLENEQFTHRLEAKVEERTAQLKAAQRELARSERLASLGHLAASVAHEINNPVSGVLNLSMLMRRILKDDGIPEGRVEEFRHYLSQVTDETARVGRIVSDLLSFSRKSKRETGPANLNDIVRSTVALVAHKVALDRVRLETDLAPDLPPILCDASQIEQVVTNLVLNGAEAVEREGRVTIATEASGDRRSVLLRVSDTGGGIREEDLSRIFDPFFTTKEDGKGVGLGLAVVYGIVEAHGGEISVDTTEGGGTTFRVRLPFSSAVVTPENPAKEAES
jgi:two-component system NtrC family sensor kinase